MNDMSIIKNNGVHSAMATVCRHSSHRNDLHEHSYLVKASLLSFLVLQAKETLGYMSNPWQGQ